MELSRHEKLHFKDAKSDKIYEVDLYHVQGNEYIVNFRYGRRGGTLKEGTKTVFPLQKEKAEKVFEDLVASKIKKGYQQVQSYDDTIVRATPDQIPSFESSKARSIVLSYLNKKANGEVLNNKWKLSRIIWRAGELEIEEAIPPITELLSGLKGQDLYAAIWSLGRIASAEAYQVLKTIPLNTQDLHYRILLGALVNSGDAEIRDSLINGLPTNLKASYISKSYSDLKAELTQSLSLPKTNADYLLTLYYLSIHDGVLNQLLNEILSDISVVPGIWKHLRYIYKVAEMIKDGATFGQIARLVNLRPSFYRKSPWSDSVRLDGQYVKVKEALAGEEPLLAFSKKTKDYFIKRTLRRLRKAGVDKMESYCELASGILIAYVETDEAKQYERNHYEYDWQSRTSTNTLRTYPPMAKVPYFYYILFAQGDRIEIPSKLEQYFSTSGLNEWTSREDSFSELWNRFPLYAVKIIAYSKQRDAMNFGLKILEGRSDLDELLTLEHLMLMVSSPFEEVLEFSLRFIEKKYDSNKPNEDLIISLIESNNEKAVDLALELLERNKVPFSQNVEFIQTAILSPSPSIHEWLKSNIDEATIGEADLDNIFNYCLNEFKANVAEKLNDLTHSTLVKIFPVYLKKLDAETILGLINEPQVHVQLFGAKLINLNERKQESWPDEVMINLLSSEHALMREEGMKLFSSLTDKQLVEKKGFIVQLASNGHQDLRLQARKIIGRLAIKNNDFGESVLLGLYDVLVNAPEDEELFTDVYDTIEEHLFPYTGILKPELDEMLKSNIREIHFLTYKLLENEKIADWSVGEIAKLGAHDMKLIRAKARKYFEENVDKVKYEKFEAINILDTDWEEIRSFGREYFDSYFTEKEWEPELVIALCDNVRPETQAYGTRILGQYFKQEHGAKYLTALSEHPSPIVELYSTNYLDRYALNNQSTLDKLKPYFIRCLSAINTRRAAKKRVFHFLKKQAFESEESAAYVTDILNNLVGTIVVRENENYISLLYELKQKHPELEINIENEPLEVR